MAINNKVGEATIEVTAVDNSGPVIDRALAQAQAAAVRVNGPAFGPNTQEAAALRKGTDALIERAGITEKVNDSLGRTSYATARFADQQRTMAESLKGARQAAFGLVGQLGAVAAVATTFYTIGKAISEGVTFALQSGTERAEEFKLALVGMGEDESIAAVAGQAKKLREEMSALASGNLLANVKALFTNTDVAKLQEQLQNLESGTFERRRQLSEIAKRERAKDAQEEINDAKKKEAEKTRAYQTQLQAEIESKRESLREQLLDAEQALMDEEGAAEFAYQRRLNKLEEQYQDFLGRNMQAEASEANRLIEITRAIRRKELDDKAREREQEANKVLKQQRELAEKIAAIYRDSADSATSSAGFEPVVAEIRTVSSLLKSIKENSATTASYAGLAGEPS